MGVRVENVNFSYTQHEPRPELRCLLDLSEPLGEPTPTFSKTLPHVFSRRPLHIGGLGGWWWWWASGVRNLPCSHIPCHLEETPPTPPPPLHRHNPDACLDVAAADQVERRGSVCVGGEGGGGVGGLHSASPLVACEWASFFFPNMQMRTAATCIS